MIELSWKDSELEYCDILKNITNFITWLANILAAEEENRKIRLRGYMTIADENKKFSTLLICSYESQKDLLTVLQQPPEEFKEKYVACVLSEEPTPVQEKEEDGEMSETKEETATG